MIVANVPARLVRKTPGPWFRLARRVLRWKREPSLEIHIPISPTASFFTMIHYLAATLRANGGIFADARLVVSVGDDCEPFEIDIARPELAKYNITWLWLSREKFRELSYGATGLKRWEEPFEADYVLMADADLCIMRDFSDVVDRFTDRKSIAGVIAGYPPFMARGEGNVDRRRWRDLFRIAGLGEPPWDSRHPGYEIAYSADHGIAEAPPYFNYGFVLGTREAMNAIRQTLEADCGTTANFMKSDLSAQAALTLSIVRNGVAYHALPVNYNFWSADWYLSAYPRESADLRILHYLSPPFRKHHDNESHVAIGRWIEAHAKDPAPIVRFMVQQLGRAHAIVEASMAEWGMQDEGHVEGPCV